MRHRFNKKAALISLIILVSVVFILTHNNIEKEKINKKNIEENQVKINNEENIKAESNNIEEVKEEISIKESFDNNYTEDEKIILAKAITAEAGCWWLSEEHKLLAGSVVLNRVEHELFPNTIEDVVYAEGQYASVKNGKFDKIIPSDESLKLAEKLLEDGSICPDNVVFQAEFKQGDGVYKKIYDETLGTTTYFCYKND
ncbi:cell wall hydrolase [Anaerovorax sp. IOR16]|uniref:cell wall hydrolase n=1 Tax=Anaerovorax sp. IOR16 TaxID=2773458 RepID=UPI0019D13754|nr:cell wall hydrolase [Anaerovorax sp. IOR16]